MFPEDDSTSGDSIDELPVDESKVTQDEFKLINEVFDTSDGSRFELSNRKILNISLVAAIIFTILMLPYMQEKMESMLEFCEESPSLVSAGKGMFFFTIFAITLKALGKWVK